MSPARIQFVARGRRSPFFRAPALASADRPWAGFSFEQAVSPGEPMASHSWSRTTLIYATGGQGSLRWKFRGVWSEDEVSAGTVSILPREVEIQSAVPSGSFPMIVLQLDFDRLQALAPEQVAAVDRSLRSAHVTRDARLAALLSAMSAEVGEGCPSGRLYGESMSAALLAYLAGRYATLRVEGGCETSLSSGEMRTLVGHIRENLAEAISVTELAALVGRSPSHFARLFKAAFGTTPYQFVMRERVASAKALLAATALSASQVASDIGFSSQSHFAKVFRQFTGATPKQYRAGL